MTADTLTPHFVGLGIPNQREARKCFGSTGPAPPRVRHVDRCWQVLPSGKSFRHRSNAVASLKLEDIHFGSSIRRDSTVTPTWPRRSISWDTDQPIRRLGSTRAIANCCNVVRANKDGSTTMAQDSISIGAPLRFQWSRRTPAGIAGAQHAILSSSPLHPGVREGRRLDWRDALTLSLFRVDNLDFVPFELTPDSGDSTSDRVSNRSFKVPPRLLSPHPWIEVSWCQPLR